MVVVWIGVAAVWFIFSLYLIERDKSERDKRSRLERRLELSDKRVEAQEALIKSLKEQIKEIRNGFRISESVSDREQCIYIKCESCDNDLWGEVEEGVMNSILPVLNRVTCKKCGYMRSLEPVLSPLPTENIFTELDLLSGKSCYKLPIGVSDVLSVRIWESFEDVSDCSGLARLTEYEFSKSSLVSCRRAPIAFFIDSFFNAIHFWPTPDHHMLARLELKREINKDSGSSG